MAVDEKYVEIVKNEEEFEDILDEFGITGSFEQNDNGIDFEDYMVTYLKEMYHDDICPGRPVLSDIYEVSFTNKNTGETTTQHKIDLVLFDDTYEDEKEAYVFPINLNSDNIDFEKNTVKDVHSASGLYALAMGLMELRAKGIHNAYNKLDLVNISLLQKQIKKYSNLTVKVVEKKFTGNGQENYYNSFRITEGEQ